MPFMGYERYGCVRATLNYFFGGHNDVVNQYCTYLK